MTTKPLTRREIVGYGLGDMGFNFYWTNISTFLLIFYTDTFGISAAAAATMLFVVKIFTQMRWTPLRVSNSEPTGPFPVDTSVANTGFAPS